MEVKRSNELEHKFPNGKDEYTYQYGKSDQIFHTDQLFLYSELIPAGRKASAPHSHSAIDEIIYITEGELIAHEGDEFITLKKGDSICFKAKSEKKHFLENKTDSDAQFLIFRSSIKTDDVIY